MTQYLFSFQHKLMLIFLMAIFSTSGAYSQTLEQQSAELDNIANAATETTSIKAIAVANAFDRLMLPFLDAEKIKLTTPSDLKILFRAADMTAFYTAETKYVEYLQRISEVSEERKLITGEHYTKLYFALLQVRMLKEADALLAQHRLFVNDALPPHREAPDLSAQMPTEWLIEANSLSLLRRNVDINQGSKIIVVSSPGCPFSRNAVRDISQDPALMTVFREHGKWLVPQMRHSYFHDIQKWNRSFPNFQMTMVYQRQEWKDIDHWGTPTFYFFKNGKLSSKVTGWPEQGNIKELKNSLKIIGLL